MAASEESKQQIQQMYVAYYGRPGDPAGLEFWAKSLDVAKANGGTIDTIINAFGTSAEFLAGNGMGTTAEQVTTLYQQMFNREPDAEGLAFWVNQIDSGAITLAQSALAIAQGATNTDAQDVTTLANKVLAADCYTQQVTKTGASYDTADIPAAVAIIAGVTDDPVTVVQSKDAIDAAMEAQGGTGSGETIVLTTGLDTVSASAPDVKDTVKGVIDCDGTDDNSTFTVADSITGNGRTVVEIIVADIDSTTFTAPFVQMRRVNELNFVNGTDGTLKLNASTYGTDISEVSLSGADDLRVEIADLTVEGTLVVEVAGGTESQVTITGTQDGLGFTADVSNDTDNTTTSTLSLSTLAIDMAVGDHADIDARIFQAVTESAAAVSVGDLTVGDISLTALTSGEFELTVSNFALNTGLGTATVGDLTIGNITMDMGISADDNDIAFSNTATATSGAATAGNLTVGNINVTVADGAEIDDASFDNHAYSYKGDATVGNVVIGDINMAGTGDNRAGDIGVSQSASARSTGDATAGDITVGNVTYSGTDDAGNMEFDSENNAWADMGNAVVGNTLIGDINLTAGHEVTGNASMSVSIAQSATADSTGDAAVGNITIGDVNMTVGTNGSMSLEVYNHAEADTGAATVGEVTVGNITANIGAGGLFSASISAVAEGTTGDTVGNFTVGDVTLFGHNDASLDLFFRVYASNGDVADFTLGNISMQLDNDGELDLSIDVSGENIGNVNIGSVDLILGGTSSSIDTFSVSVTAWSGDIASFSIGDVAISGASNSYGDDLYFYVYASNDIGDITLGDISIVAGVSASFDSNTYKFTADGGEMGNVRMGDVTLTAATDAYIWNAFYFEADNDIGNVVVGDITLSAAESATANLSHNVTNQDDIGDITYGDISLSAMGEEAFVWAFISADNDDSHDIGAITIGDIDLKASGLGATASLTMSFTSADTIGLVTVGDIDISLANVAAATTGQDALAYLRIDSEGNTGDVTVGDISLGTTEISASYTGVAEVSAAVWLSSSDDLNIGDISVVGGFANTADVVLDNFANLTGWLNLSAGGDMTVGDIDYSGYEVSATIDASGFVMGGNFTAAQGDTVISDTVDKNVITLGAGTDEVILDNAATTDETDETAIDEIVNFTHGTDLITVDLDDTDFIYSSVGTSYADFLTDAAASMTNFSADVFAQKVGANTYVAFDVDADGDVDFAIELTGIPLVDADDFNIV